MSGRVQLVIPTPGGRLAIATAAGSDACAGCRQPATIVLAPSNTRPATVPLCGGCLCTGIAVWLGARHVAAGGDLATLSSALDPSSYEPPKQ